jgi:SAM-dependent methyltransferase
MPPHNESTWVGLAMPRPSAPAYRPDVFDVASEAHARQIILTPERGTTTDERWQKETPFLVEDISKHLSLTANTCLLDYGCGIGRLAKPLIEKHDCRVVGVDVSPSMRLLAPGHVLSDRFLIWSPEVLDQMIAKGFRADAAITSTCAPPSAKPSKKKTSTPSPRPPPPHNSPPAP